MPECQAPFCWAPAPYQCDFPIERDDEPASCDLYVCDDHATEVGEDEHYCPTHIAKVAVCPQCGERQKTVTNEDLIKLINTWGCLDCRTSECDIEHFLLTRDRPNLTT
jgi:hypothetical protein